METSAPKRRRTSPRTSIPVHPKPPAESTTPQDEPPQPASAAIRPSFASPTKASLERHNPDILRRRSSPPKRSQRDRESVPRPASRGHHDPVQKSAAQPEGSAEATLDGLSQEDISGVAQRRSESVLKSPAKRLGLRRSLNPQPRPLPPPAPDDEEEMLNPFARKGLRRTPPPGVETTEPVVPEPELPPTPEQPDPVVSTPPSGIHNTPSRLPRRNRALAEKIKSSSPLKNPPVVSSPGRDDPPPPFRLPTKPTKDNKTTKTGRPGPSQGLSAAEIRGIQPAGPDAEKRKLRDALLAEVAELEHDLDVAARELERLNKTRFSNTRSSPPRNKQDILGLLRRHTLPQDKEPVAAPSTSWLHSALDPIAFLPFGKVTTKPATLFPSKDSKAEQEAPVSHHPLPMSAEEALPYLQVFTPLTFTTHITTTPNPDDSNGPLHQKHSISATSTVPRGLFSARFDMTVNTRTMAVVDLSVSRLDPSAAAELQPFIDRISAKTQPLNSGLYNNVNIMGWAMGEWLRLATQRASAWCVLERELGSGRSALEGLVGRIKQRKKKKRRRRGVDDEDDDEDSHVAGKEDSGKRDTADLLPFMGRTSMEFEIPLLVGGDSDDEDSTSVLRVQWRISFDWTGEGRAGVGVLVGVPGKCKLPQPRPRTFHSCLLTAPGHKCDEKGRLSDIPRLFDDLIRAGEEPLAAVRTVACLLAGGQRA